MAERRQTAGEAGHATVLVGPPVPGWLREATGETLVELLDRAVTRTPHAIAMLLRDGVHAHAWTYAEIARAVDRASVRLAAHGIGPGRRVLTWAASDPLLAIACFAAWRLGAAIVPLDLRMTPDVAVRIGRAADCLCVLAGPAVDAADVARLGLPVVPVTPDLVADEPGEAAGTAAPVEPSTLAEILFTSGTTSDPKGVTITHGQMIHSVRAVVLASGVRRAERLLALAPLSHAYGQMVPLFGGLVTGSQTTYLPALTPLRIVDALRRDRVTAMVVVPQFMQIMLERIDGEAAKRGRLGRLERARRLALTLRLPMALRRRLFRDVHAGLGGSLTLLGSGGAKLPGAVQMAWEAMGVRVVQAYGATECSAIVGHDRNSRRPGTVGRPLAGLQVRIAEDGELLARGPNASDGYWNRPDETAEMLAGGWVHTGDAAAVDRHGEIVILGRTRDRIALPNGMKVYPEDVEQALRGAGAAVRDAVVLESTPGQLAAAVLAPPEADDEAIAAAVRDANGSLAPHQRVRRWRRWPGADFPRTHTLKVRRAEVAAWFGAGVEEGERAGDREMVRGEA